jgi:hypothetical protein
MPADIEDDEDDEEDDDEDEEEAEDETGVVELAVAGDKVDSELTLSSSWRRLLVVRASCSACSSQDWSTGLSAIMLL